MFKYSRGLSRTASLASITIALALGLRPGPGLAQIPLMPATLTNVQQSLGLTNEKIQTLSLQCSSLVNSGFPAAEISSVIQLLLLQGKSIDEIGSYLESLAQYLVVGLTPQEALVTKALAAKDEEVVADMAKKLENEEATQKRFLGLNWSLGIGASYDFKGERRVQSAKLVAGKVDVDQENRSVTRLIYETHYFFPFPEDRRTKTAVAKGHGPFFGIQSSDNKALEAFAAGYMFGWRHDPEKSESFNIGLGAVLDPSVQVLGGGLKDGQPLPVGETEVRFKKEDRWGILLVGSFSF